MTSASKKPGMISCVIPVYNREKLIIECVKSVLSQTYKNYEIVIVDDGSTDSTPDVLNKLMLMHPGIVSCYSQVNQGPGQARQTGLNKVRGEYVQFLDSDDLIKPKKFELFISEFNKTPATDIVYCVAHHYVQGKPEEYIVWKQQEQQTTSILPAFLRSRAWSTSTPIYRKSLLDAAGEILPLCCEEDLEYDCRIGLQSPKISFVNQHLTDFRGHKGQRFSVNNPDRRKQISHQITAREGIHQTLLQTHLSNNHPDVKVFAQSLFLLSRQAAEMNLIPESNQALKIAQSAGAMLNLKDKLAIRVYTLARLLAGPKTGASIFNAIYNRMHNMKHTQKM